MPVPAASQLRGHPMARAHSLLPSSLPPRGLSREQAAEYIGVGVTKFLEMVKDGRMPQPKRIDNRVIWDTRKLDPAFDALEDKAAPPKPRKWDAL
jgi:hypothetical protein